LHNRSVLSVFIFLIEKPVRKRHPPFMQSAFSGPVYVVRDNIDTDQIIPAQYLNLVPTRLEKG